jgi:hypothetical protein
MYANCGNWVHCSCGLGLPYTGRCHACVCLQVLNEPISFFINFGTRILLGLIRTLNFTVLQRAKMIFVQISEVVLTVTSLDGHKILSCDRIIKNPQFIV